MRITDGSIEASPEAREKEAAMETVQSTVLNALRHWMIGLAHVGASLRAPY